MNPCDFFALASIIYRRYDLRGILYQTNIVPNGMYLADDFSVAIRQILHVDPQISCSNWGYFQVLEDIRLCLTTDNPPELMDCPIKPEERVKNLKLVEI